MDEPDQALAAIVRREAGLIVAALHRRTGDFEVAEEAVQEAVVAALRSWRSDGVPPNPGGWLALTARRRAVDLLRRRRREARLADELAADPTVTTEVAAGPATEDERLPMLFGCCHPSLGVEARLALTLRAVVGATTAQIAHAFLVPEATMAQRLVRAKRKIVRAGIPFVVPEPEQLGGRLDDVLTVVYLGYTAGYLDPRSTALADDARWLAELVVRALPDEPEAWGLLALLTFTAARAAARFDDRGGLVLLADQDRSRWDRVATVQADAYLAKAAAMRRPGRFQLQAAIAACHAEAPIWAATDWLQILTLYDVLLTHHPSPVVRLNHAIALAQVSGPTVALAELERLEPALGGYHLWHAARARLLDDLGDRAGARRSDARALSLTSNPVEQALLVERLSAGGR